MRRQFCLLLGIGALLLIGCNGTGPNPPVVIPTAAATADSGAPPTVAVEDTPTTEPVSTDPPQSTDTPSPATETPTPTAASLPVLGILQFSESQSGPASTQFTAPNEVFVQFDYANIPDGASIRRDWYLNGVLFISREEAWDGATYGQTGTRSDISIFDYAEGLTVGEYRVEFFLNSEFKGNGTFSILPPLVVEPPVQGELKFSHISFKGLGPYSVEFGNVLETPTEMFAMMSYNNMVNGDLMRRDWYFNNELFISKEETWDVAKWDTAGWREDISIFDYETGLASGNYRLELFVNGQFQVAQTVDIVPHYQMVPQVEAISGKMLTTLTNNTLVVEGGGVTLQTSVAGRITVADWFPGGDRVIFGAKVLTDQTAPLEAFAHKHELYLWDLTTDSVTQIGNLDDNYRTPLVAPDGRTVAILSGSGYGDACVVDLWLSFLTVDPNSSAFTIDPVTNFDFGAIDTQFGVWTAYRDDDYASKQPLTANEFFFSPGRWIDGNQFETSMGFGDCSDNHGTYQFDLTNKTAVKIQ